MSSTAAPRPMRTPEGAAAATDWTLASGVRHLNHGSFGAVPRAAQRAQAELRAEMEQNPCSWFSLLHERVAVARGEVAAYLGADPGSTALAPNASAGMSTAFLAVPGFEGMEVLLTDHAYGAVAMGAERLARRWGGSVRTIRIPLDAGPAAAAALVEEQMSERTGLVCVDHVTSATARVLPTGEIAAAARRRGIPVVVDAAHSPGLHERPLDGIDADIWVGNLHKFACAPRGTAAIVARGPLAERLEPLIDSWGAPYAYPENFDHQGTLDVTGSLAASVAFATIEERYGWHATRRYLSDLADYGERVVTEAMSVVADADCAVDVGAPVSAMRLIRLPAALAFDRDDAADLRTHLSIEAGVETAITNWNGQGFLRLSTHLYNTSDDFDDFADRVVPIIGRLARSAERGEPLHRAAPRAA